MDRREFLGSAIGASLAIGGMLRLPSSLAAAKTQIIDTHKTISFTDGEITVNNHLGSLAQLHRIYELQPTNLAISNAIISSELVNSQFLGDYTSLERLTDLSTKILSFNPKSSEAYIQAAQIAASTHQFEIANKYLHVAKNLNGNHDDIRYVELSILQATGKNLNEVLSLRRDKALASGAPEELVPYAALLADLNQVKLANSTYLNALAYQYKSPSPFIPAWICFQLGMLWGELAEVPNTELASSWYKKAVNYLPQYTRARIHLAETYMDAGENELALQVLQPALASSDPEVSWRISEIYENMNQSEVSAQYLQLANTMFTRLLEKHTLAFADHAVQFYMGPGNNPPKAHDLALLNFQNRPTNRAANLLRNTNSAKMKSFS